MLAGLAVAGVVLGAAYVTMYMRKGAPQEQDKKKTAGGAKSGGGSFSEGAGAVKAAPAAAAAGVSSASSASGSASTSASAPAPASATPVSASSSPPPLRFPVNIAYPLARRSDHTDVIHGVQVHDPYRWLEDPDSAETKAWVEAQTRVTDSYLETLPSREKFRARMTELYNYDQYGAPRRKGDWIFFWKKAGLQNQYVLYKQFQSLDAEEQVLLDPNAMAPDGSLSVSSIKQSDDGTLLAYAMSRNGSDWCEIAVRDVASGRDMEDKLQWVKFSGISWTADGQGFFYSRYPARNLDAEQAGTETECMENQKLCYHALGTPQSADIVVFERPEAPKHMFGGSVTHDGTALVVSVVENCDPKNEVFIFDLRNFPAQPLGPPLPLVTGFNASFDFVTNQGSEYFFHSNLGAPRYRVLKFRLPAWDAPAAERSAEACAALQPVEVIPEEGSGSHAVLEDVAVVAGQHLLLKYLRHVKHEMEICDLSGGNRRALPLPLMGTMSGPTADEDSNEFFFSLTSFTTPGTTYRCLLHLPESAAGSSSSGGAKKKKQRYGRSPARARARGGRSPSPKSPKSPRAAVVHHSPTRAHSAAPADWFNISVVRQMTLQGIDPDDFEVRQERYRSKDGTMIPMYIVGKKRAAGERAAPAPCLLYGYGGFNISITPSFSIAALIAVAHYGCTYAVANIRGGGEYGKEWHEAGTKLRKQNVFDDFTAAARHLVATGVTTHQQLACRGGSNGGLLVAAMVTQSPELFRAAVCQVPVADMLRFHKFTIGAAWCSDYGNADENEAEFKALLAYSPVHNVRPQPGAPYPSLMVCTASHDDRVSPLHSFKFAAEVQEQVARCAGQTNPQLIRIETKAGHGAGKPTSMVIQEAADMWAFAFDSCGATWRD